MDALPLTRYLHQVYGYSKEEIVSLHDKQFMEFAWDTNRAELYWKLTQRSSCPVYNMISIFAKMPGFRQIEQLIELMARDGYDINPVGHLERLWYSDNNTPFSLLHAIGLYELRPFGREILQALVRNGFSTLNWFYGKKNLYGLIVTIVESSLTIEMNATNVQQRSQAMIDLLLSLGLNDFYETSELNWGTYIWNYSWLPNAQIEHIYNDLIGYVLERRKRPLSLQELARNNIRRTLGGIHFAKRVAELPLPRRIRDYVQALPIRAVDNQDEPSQAKRQRVADDVN